MLIRAVAFWAAFSVRAGEPELSGYSGFCDGDIVKDAVVDFSGLSLHAAVFSMVITKDGTLRDIKYCRGQRWIKQIYK